ncbi:MAG: PAS domain-containing protein [Halobacterium sp.]
MDEPMDVLFVGEHAERRASVERSLPEHGPLAVQSVPDAPSALDALSESDVECVAVEHSATGDGTEDGTDALQVLRLVRDTDPAVPVVILEVEGASTVASDAISLDVDEYVRESDADDPLGMLARACRDCASSYRAEQDVAMLNDLARNVYERVTDGFFALDRDWRFTYVNDAAEEILEVDADDVVGENLWDVFPGAVGTDFYTEYHRAMAAQEPVTFREHYPPLEKTFEVRAFPSEDGLSVHFRTVVDDQDAEVSDHLLELTDLLSSDLLASIDALRGDLERARAAALEEDGEPPAEIEDALAAVERMESLVNYSIRLASERPMPGELQTD